MNGKSKKQGKQGKQGKQEGGGGSNIFNEDSGIPVGLLLLQRLHHDDPEHREHRERDKHSSNTIHENKDTDLNTTTLKSNSNTKLVYASIMADDDGDNGNSENIELVIMPSMSSGVVSENEYSENPIVNEIDDELYDSLVKSVSEPGSAGSGLIMIKEIVPLRKTNTTKKQHFGKHIEKVFQKRKTRSKQRK
jgi:hypothetical protein